MAFARKELEMNRPYHVSETLSGEQTTIRKYLDILYERKRKNPELEVIVMSQGDVHAVPHHGNSVKANFVNLDVARPYSPSTCLPEFAQAYVEYTKKLFGVVLNPKRVFATDGGEKAAILTMSVLSHRKCFEGKEMVNKGVWYAFAPGYPGNATAANVAGVTLRWIERSPEDYYRLFFKGLEQMEEMIRKDLNDVNVVPVGIIINTPENPTGKIWTYQEIQAVVVMAKKYKMYVACDIPYALFAYGLFGHPYNADLCFFDENGIIWDSESKVGHACGHRGGMCYVPEKLVPFFKEAAGLGASTLGQMSYLGVLLDNKINEHIEALKKFYAPVIECACTMLINGGLKLKEPESGNVIPYLLCVDEEVAAFGGVHSLHDFLAQEFVSKTNTVCIAAPWLGPIGLKDNKGLVRFALIHDKATTQRGIRAYLDGRQVWLKTRKKIIK